MIFSQKIMFIGFLITIMIFSSSYFSFVSSAYGAYAKAQLSPYGPTINDPNLSIQQVNIQKLKFPTSMAFLNEHEILVLEKNTGRVLRILDGMVMPQPALDVQVASDIERGLLGIAIAKHNDTEGKTYVFLYYTESGNGVDGSDTTAGGKVDPLGNRLYRYEYVDGKLINPLLLLDLPAIPANGRAEHNGGKVQIGPDNNVYVIVGDIGGYRTKAQNNKTGLPPNGSSGILFVTQYGKSPGRPILGLDGSLAKFYYAIGIRNSFGIDFDPVTGTLWDAEDGPDTADEINMVKPGFNSGWSQIQGYAKNDLLENGASKASLVKIGKSKYSDPKFVWRTTIGITALKFLNSDKLGREYENNMFVGDINNGLLYRFTLNDARDEININDTYSGNIQALSDNQVDVTNENQPIVFGQGFGGITDIEVGPDGYLYVLSYTGSLYRIMPAENQSIYGGKSDPSTKNVPTTTTDPNSIPVIITGINADQSFSPNPIRIQQGQTITWYNGDTVSHTITSGADGDPDEGSLFDSNAIIPSQYYSLTFDEIGEYRYYCIYHPSMVGEIIVE